MKADFRQIILNLRARGVRCDWCESLGDLVTAAEAMQDALQCAQNDDEEGWRYHENSHSSETTAKIESALKLYREL